MPSSSLVEVEVDVGVEVDDEVEVGVEVEVEDGVEVEVELGVGVWGVRVGVGLTFLVRRVEIWRVKLISTQIVVEVEVGVELDKTFQALE